MLKKQKRAYNCLLFQTHYNYFICIPYRSEISHSFSYLFKKSKRSKQHSAGLDYTKILESVKKTGKVVMASDACARGSFLDDVAKNITELAFDYLDAPPVIVGAQNWITPPFEYDEFFFPQKEWIMDAINEKIMPLEGYKPLTNVTPVEQMRKLKLGV